MNTNDFRKMPGVWRFTAMVLALALGVGLPLWVLTAADVPNTFVNGEIADADEVNENFQALKDAIEENEARIEALETTTSDLSDGADEADARITDLETTVAALSDIPAGAILYSDDDDDAALQAAGFERHASADTHAKSPPGRHKHVAIWTGTTGDPQTTNRLIVWGGITETNTQNPVNTGDVYDLASDTWKPMSTDGAPYARYDAEAAWTGTEMLVYGGDHPGDGVPHVIGRYNPTIDQWASATTVGAPSITSVSDETGVWTGSRLIIIEQGAGGSYDPVSDSWDSKPNLASGSSVLSIQHEVLAWTGTQVLVVDSNGMGGLYTLITDTWTTPAGLNSGTPVSLMNIIATGVIGDRIYLLSSPGAGSGSANVSWYDVGDDAWGVNTAAFSDVPIANALPVGAWISETETFAIFGTSGVGGVYDVAADEWTNFSGFDVGLVAGDTSATEMYNGYVALWGGYTTGQAQFALSNNGGNIFTFSGGASVWRPIPDTGRPLYAYRKQ